MGESGQQHQSCGLGWVLAWVAMVGLAPPLCWTPPVVLQPCWPMAPRALCLPKKTFLLCKEIAKKKAVAQTCRGLDGDEKVSSSTCTSLGGQGSLPEPKGLCALG